MKYAAKLNGTKLTLTTNGVKTVVDLRNHDLTGDEFQIDGVTISHEGCSDTLVVEFPDGNDTAFCYTVEY